MASIAPLLPLTCKFYDVGCRFYDAYDVFDVCCMIYDVYLLCFMYACHFRFVMCRVSLSIRLCSYPAHTAQLYMWGKVPKGSSADSWMYPKAEQDLQGWGITAIGCGKFSALIAADNNVIAFGGNVMHRELGFGVDGE